ncbi:MAG: alanyl-tRNA editing protein [Pseudomonadota bacterium]
MTKHIFTEDAYAQTCDATVVAIGDGTIELDQTVFYATSGGQPGDSGFLERTDGSRIAVAGARYADSAKITILHEVEDGIDFPDVGESLIAHIDWERRHKLMRMHTACHLLSVIVPLPITGASVSETDSRIDFDMTETADKAEITAKLMAMVVENHPVFSRWITAEELSIHPELVKSKNVRPPTTADRIRLVCIGEDAVIDSQPCGGTHVSETGEIGEMHIGKIEKKGRENRRMRIRFGHLPA